MWEKGDVSGSKTCLDLLVLRKRTLATTFKEQSKNALCLKGESLASLSPKC